MERIEKLKEFLKVNPGDSFLQHALALENIKIGNDEEAKSIFENILSRDETYVGSYYHLGKLLERRGDMEYAEKIYREGILQAGKLNDNHSRNELQAALDDITE